MISHDSIETAYCFFHQKERVYAHSNMDWQKDDIEYAISSYVDEMNPKLYALLSHPYLKRLTSFLMHLRVLIGNDLYAHAMAYCAKC